MSVLDRDLHSVPTRSREAFHVIEECFIVIALPDDEQRF